MFSGYQVFPFKTNYGYIANVVNKMELLASLVTAAIVYSNYGIVDNCYNFGTLMSASPPAMVFQNFYLVINCINAGVTIDHDKTLFANLVLLDGITLIHSMKP